MKIIIKFLKKMMIFFLWFFNIKLKLKLPIKSERIYEDKNMLFGRKYIFFPTFKENKINSPISGKIIKIFKNKRTILISNYLNLQIIIELNKKKNNSETDSNKDIKIFLKEKSKVKKGNCIFLVENIEEIENITIYIPWQPLIIKKIEKMNIYYRNPWSLLKIKLYGEYI